MGIFQIADLTISMEPREATLRQNSLAYQWKDAVSSAVDMDLRISPEQMANLQEIRPEWSADSVEYLYIGSLFACKLLNFQGFFLHASAVVYENQAYLFSAPSGTGKSTHTHLWQTCFGEDKTFILNDDKPALRLMPEGWIAYGTPFSGKVDLSRNVGVPLKAICFLERGEQNRIVPMPKDEILQNVLWQTYRPYYLKNMDALLQLLDHLIRHIPVYQMQCNMEPEAAYLAYEAMRR